jgi:DHA1 family inner membrane transport protein
MPIPLLALAASAFAIGTTEFVIMGLLPDVAASLGVSIPSAGLLVTGYALGVVAGAPILTLLTNRWQRKNVLLALMGVFILGNLLCAVAPDYGFLMAARVVTSFAHGSFFGVGSVVAAGLVSKDKQASAIAMMFTGLTLANILGVPFGTLVGQALGWRATFWVVTGLGVVAAVAIALLVPAKQEGATPSLSKELSVLARPQVWLALLTTVLGFGGVFTVFTYITPILEQVTGLSPHAVSAVLLLFGVGLTLGNAVGGKLADRALMPTLIAVLAVLALVMALFSVTSHSAIPAIVTIFVWGIAGFATVPPLQMRMVEKAKDAPNLASSLNIGAFNLGNAGGATLGGVIIDHGLNFAWVSIAGALVAAAGLAAALLGASLDDKARRLALGI